MFTNLSQIQISGLIALVVSTPFLIKSVRNFLLANASKQWPKVSGTILKAPEFSRKYSLQYEYTVEKMLYKSNNICFTNSNRPINQRANEFEEKYALNKQVAVYYNPDNPKKAVLEPGRKDGLLLAIIFLGVLFVFGCLALLNQGLILQLI